MPMAARRITVSCPKCRDQFKQVLIDEAERILFNGCTQCRGPTGGDRGKAGTAA